MQPNTSLSFALEVCVDSLRAIEFLGTAATRIEISQQLSIGGITPTENFVRDALKASPVEVVVLIRCRGGGFQYSPSERVEMLDSVLAMDAMGVKGVVVGALRSDGELDWEFMESVVRLFPAGDKIVHRAFDLTTQPITQLKRLNELGYKRVLTSGGPPTAVEGINRLREWNATGCVEILPAGGIRSCNAATIVQETGCWQLHGSFRSDSVSESLPDLDDIHATRTILEKLTSART